MIKEYIMAVGVDDDGYEHGMRRIQELVRCVNCKHCHAEPILFGGVHERVMLLPVRHICEITQDEIVIPDYFRGRGERR